MPLAAGVGTGMGGCRDDARPSPGDLGGGGLGSDGTGGSGPPFDACADSREDKVFVCSGDVDVYREGNAWVVRAREGANGGAGGYGGADGGAGGVSSEGPIASHVPWVEWGEAAPAPDDVIIQFRLCSLDSVGSSLFAGPVQRVQVLAAGEEVCRGYSSLFVDQRADGAGWMGGVGTNLVVRVPAADFECLSMGRGLTECLH
ncbi:MAG TPA: hypothetical protein VLC09_13750 [Polyangiaceae bacterium]|nr:hypothetical protein [Polyangiaceae bacterium]